MQSTRGSDRARIALGSLRVAFGTVALLAPGLLSRRIGERDSPAATYAFRMFGIRTVLLGRHLLVRAGPELRHALDEAPLVHGSDTATATLLTLAGKVPRRTGLLLVAVSAANTALAVVARRSSTTAPPTPRQG